MKKDKKLNLNKETQIYEKYTLGAKVEMMIFRNQQIINSRMDTPM